MDLTTSFRTKKWYLHFLKKPELIILINYTPPSRDKGYYRKYNLFLIQTHKHTFTCQKKNKIFTVRQNEGHGKNDGKFEGPKITNYVQCRFNFPQFPLNKTRFILGMSKSLDEKEIKQRFLLPKLQKNNSS